MAWWESLLVALASGGVTAGLALLGVRATLRATREATTTNRENAELQARTAREAIEHNSDHNRKMLEQARSALNENLEVSREIAREVASYNRESNIDREKASRREEWWRRFCWAADLSLSDSDSTSESGLRILAELDGSTLATATESQMVRAFADRKLDEYLQRRDRLKEAKARNAAGRGRRANRERGRGRTPSRLDRPKARD